MRTSFARTSGARHLGRTLVGAAIVALGVIAVPLAAGADPAPADAAATITAVTGTNGNVTVTWTNDAADATGLDVILYDQNGNVLEDDALAASATSDTFANVADGGGYSVDVITHTPGGDLDAGGSTPFDVYQGTYIVDNAPTIVRSPAPTATSRLPGPTTPPTPPDSTSSSTTRTATSSKTTRSQPRPPRTRSPTSPTGAGTAST